MESSFENKVVELSKLPFVTIFGYLSPRDWINISEVCSTWKKIIEEVWKKKGTKIALDSHDALMSIVRESEPENHPEVPLISMNEAQRMVQEAVPFAEFLSDKRLKYFTEQETLLKIGRYVYQVENDKQTKSDYVNHKKLLKFIARKATSLTDLDLHRTPVDELQMLFNSNTITKVVGHEVNLSAAHDWCKATERINELVIRCSNSIEDLKTFQGNFSNLSKLHLTLCIRSESILRVEEPRCLSQILPFVTKNLKSFKLTITGVKGFDLAADYFGCIFNSSQLEEFELHLTGCANIKSTDYFFEKLISSCPKLQIVRIHRFLHGDKAVFKLMELSNLMTLYCHSTSSLCPTKVPKSNSLSTCYIFSDGADKVDAIISLLEKMPQLLNLRLYNFNFIDFFDIVYNVQKLFPTKQIEIKIKFSCGIKNDSEVKVIVVESQEETKSTASEVLDVTLKCGHCSLDEKTALFNEVTKDLRNSSLKGYTVYWWPTSMAALMNHYHKKSESLRTSRTAKESLMDCE